MPPYFLEQFENLLNTGSKSQKVIMRYFLSDFPISALSNLSTIARHCGVSPATVQRCVVKLGYERFSEFHKDVLKHLENSQQSHPLERLKQKGHNSQSYYEYNINNIQTTFANINPMLIEQAVQLLTNEHYKIYCIGGRFTGVLVNLFARHVKTLRPNVFETVPYDGFMLDILSNCNAKTVILVTDIRRYDDDLFGFSKLAKTEKQAKIILLTDTWISPISQYADITISVSTGMDACWDSNVAMLTMLEEIMGQVTAHLGKKAQKFLESREHFRNNMD